MLPEGFIRPSALLLVLAAIFIMGHYRRRADRADKVVAGHSESGWAQSLRSLSGAIFYLGLLTYLVHPPALNWSAIADWPVSARWAGVVLMAANLPLVVWTLRSLGHNFTSTVETRDNHTLVTSGPYAHIRHPFYTFGAVFFLGAVLVAGNWFLLICAIVGLWGLFSRTPLEEQMLLKRFGSQYEAYMHSTGRYLPRLLK
ncbi:MAG: isoprenylcysteine carboxylmethyltransferase family protein [Anaerolineales bacterium]|nr:isoprenylcysteine carboxylmethyltransferase family protein [Anaerolineales bacterium]